MPGRFLATLLAATIATGAHASFVTLYDQDFEAPNDPPGFINGAGSGYKDISQQTVNSLYGDQPSGFAFAQTFTVETVLLTGNSAFGTGYSDPNGVGGNYAIMLLSSVQDDRLGLSFDAAGYDFFNLRVDFSSLGSDGFGGSFTDGNSVPTFRFTLFDNPGGARNVSGNGTVLDQGEVSGTASRISTLDWTRETLAFDLTSATNGNVTLQVNLLSGGLAVFDNLLITASDTPGGGLTPVPVPPALPLLAIGVAGLAALARRHR